MKRIALAVAAVVFVLTLVSAANLQAATTWTGWITDESCGTKGANADHKACILKCVGKGAKLVFYNNADQKLYKIDKQDVVKEHIGHEVKVTGELSGDVIKIASIDATQ